MKSLTGSSSFRSFLIACIVSKDTITVLFPFSRTLVSFVTVFRDVTQRSLSGERCVTSRKTAAQETSHTPVSC